MIKTQENIIRNEIADFSLIWCMQLAEFVKEPPYIPLFEVCTYDLVGKYFGVAGKRIQTIYKAYREVFENDCAIISGRDVMPISIKNVNTSKGYQMTFANGIETDILYSGNLVFNARAILQFALFLETESNVALRLATILHHLIVQTQEKQRISHRIKPRRAWFLYAEPDKDWDKFTGIAQSDFDLPPDNPRFVTTISTPQSDTLNVKITVK